MRVHHGHSVKVMIMCINNIWKLEVPKDRIVSLIDLMDADEDGFVSFGEVRDLLKEYGVKLKRSMRFAKKN